MVSALTSHPKILDLLEQYMEMNGWQRQWITVQELRTFFNLDRTRSPVITGILRRLYQNPAFSCPYQVVRIEKCRDATSTSRMIYRYLVQKRATQKNSSSRMAAEYNRSR